MDMPVQQPTPEAQPQPAKRTRTPKPKPEVQPPPPSVAAPMGQPDPKATGKQAILADLQRRITELEYACGQHKQARAQAESAARKCEKEATRLKAEMLRLFMS